MNEPKGRGAAWTEEQTTSEPEGAPYGTPQASGRHRVSTVTLTTVTP